MGRWRVVAVLVVIGAAYTCTEYQQRRANTPEALERAAGNACVAILHHDSDAMRYSGRRLDAGTEADVVAIDQYLDHSRADSEALAATGDLAVTNPTTGHALLVEAAQACTNLGHPELQEHLYKETGNEDYAPNRS